MTYRKERMAKAKKINYRRIELLLPPHLHRAIDDYRASKRPIPIEGDTIRFLITEALIEEGFDPGEPIKPDMRRGHNKDTQAEDTRQSGT